VENDHISPLGRRSLNQERIKSQTQVEEWLRGQCVLAGVDPLRVRLAADVKPLFLRQPQPEDFPPELFEVAQGWFHNHTWSYEELKVTVYVHDVHLASHSGIIIGGAFPVLNEQGNMTSKTVLSYEDPLAEWLSLAATAVNAAADMLTMLRGVEVSWPGGEPSQSSPVTTKYETSPTPN
jgi:hypothetical protein